MIDIGQQNNNQNRMNKMRMGTQPTKYKPSPKRKSEQTEYLTQNQQHKYSGGVSQINHLKQKFKLNSMNKYRLLPQLPAHATLQAMEKNLLQELADIDAYLQQTVPLKLRYHCGFLFYEGLKDDKEMKIKVVEGIRKGGRYIQQGWKILESQTDIKGMNQKLLNKSVQNIEKYEEEMKLREIKPEWRNHLPKRALPFNQSFQLLINPTPSPTHNNANNSFLPNINQVTSSNYISLAQKPMILSRKKSQFNNKLNSITPKSSQRESKGRGRVMTEPHSQNNSKKYSSKNSLNSNLKIINKSNNGLRGSLKEGSPEECAEHISLEELQRQLSKNVNFLSVWIPPSSYPQFHSLIVYNIHPHSSQTVILKRYLLPLHSMTSRFFDALIAYLSLQLDRKILYLQMVIEKEIWKTWNQKDGWKIGKWDGQKKYRIIYGGLLEL